MPKILIADDHSVVRQGIRQILVEHYPKASIGEAASAAEVLQQIEKIAWNLVILDISMPGRGGIDTLKEIKRLKPNLPVLILSMHPVDQFAVRVLRSGAAGYLSKNGAPGEVILAVRKVLAGGRYLSAEVSEELACEIAGQALGNPHQSLSDREYQVLRHIAAGKTVSEVAIALSLSIKTVSTYRTRVLEKLNLHTDADIGRYAQLHSLDL